MMLLSPLFVLGRPRIFGFACLGAFLAVPFGLSAAPLEKAECERLQSEKQALMVLGVDKEFSKGPDWAQANLAPPELNLIKRYLIIDEQLKFRCGLATVTLQLPTELEDSLLDGVDLPSASAPPLPPRRGQAVAKPAPKPGASGSAAAAPKPMPAAKAGAIPVLPAPVKPAPKSAAPKAQSSWNAETRPVESIAPAAVEQIEPLPSRSRPARSAVRENGDGG
jgi:hypothetical protein